MNKIHTLLDSLRYQYPNGITTMSYCSTGCGKSARGGHKCKDCIGDDLERLGANKLLVYVLQSKYTKLQTLQSEIEDIKDKIIKGVNINGNI